MNVLVGQAFYWFGCALGALCVVLAVWSFFIPGAPGNAWAVMLLGAGMAWLGGYLIYFVLVHVPRIINRMW